MPESNSTPKPELTPEEITKRAKNAAWQREYRAKNREELNARRRERGKNQRQIERAKFLQMSDEEKAAVRKKVADKKRRVRKKNPKPYAEANKRWEAKNREKHRAWMNAYQREWRQKNRDELLKQRRAWRAYRADILNKQARDSRVNETPEDRAARLAKCRVYSRRQWEKFRESLKLRQRIYYRLNTEVVQKKNAEYNKTPRGREVKRISEGKRNARKRGNGGSGVTIRQWEHILKTFRYRCFWCGCRLHAKNISMDHLVPISKGGPHDVTNVAPACRPCNTLKNARDPMEFAEEVIAGQKQTPEVS